MTTTVPGVAVITYKRPDHLAKCLDRIRQHTADPFELLVACDAPDEAETADLCREFNAILIKGDNRGVVWNKNRALYYYMSQTQCDPIILIEDDVFPISDSWLSEWVDAARRWHHVNFSHPGLLGSQRPPLRGDGTAEKPHVHHLVTGQCTAISREAMKIGGYLDTRFHGYGHGHVEWTKRHNKLMFGSLLPEFSPKEMVFLSITGGLKSDDAPTFRTDSDVERNGLILRTADRERPQHLDPWRSPEEKAALNQEVSSVITPAQLSKRKPINFFNDYLARRKSAASAKFTSCVDSLTHTPTDVVVRGWAFDADGLPVESMSVTLGGRPLENAVLTRVVRKDVTRQHAKASSLCGFEVAFPSAPPNGGTNTLQLFAQSNSGESRKLIYTATIGNTPQAVNKNWTGKNLYFGNLYPHEKQFSDGKFVGLSLKPKFDRDVSHDAYNRLPVADNTVEKIQSQDVFEHLRLESLPSILDEIYRVLAPGGTFRLSVPDYRSPLLKGRSVYNDTGEVLADLMMGGSVAFDPTTHKTKVTFLTNGDAHLWFPTYEIIKDLIARSNMKECDQKFYHYHLADGSFVSDQFPDLGMPVTRAPPFDMRANGQPISIIVDFVKRGDKASARDASATTPGLAANKWLPSRAASKPSVVVPNAPHMPKASVRRLFELMQNSSCYVEYGTGGTTVKASEIDIPAIVCVESDAAWLDAVRHKVEPMSGKQVRHFIHADIGQTKEWGHPSSESHWRQYHHYPLAPWKLARKKGLSPDLVLIDGRFRIACCLASFIFAKPGSRVLFDDYLDRPFYHVVERFVARTDSVERVAEFLVPEDLPRDDIWLALIAAATDPR